jgi:hypothetical protein
LSNRIKPQWRSCGSFRLASLVSNRREVCLPEALTPITGNHS